MPPKSTQALEETILSLSERLADLHASMDQRHKSLVAAVSDLRHQFHSFPPAPSPLMAFAATSPSTPPPPPPALSPSTSSSNLKLPKLTLPPFDGSNPLDWVFQAEQFFTFYQVPQDHRLDLISFYMQGDALSWFKWMFTNRHLSSWDAFIRSLELRFGPSSFDNHEAMLFKLRQHGFVTDFQAEFERLCNRVVGLPPESILNCFISGLRPNIQWELAVLRSFSISQVVGLAKLIEAKNVDARRSSTPARFSTPPSLPPLLSAPPPKPPFPARRLTPAEMQARCAQGLCFNCDDKFSPGHKCKAKQFLLLLPDDIDADLVSSPPSDPDSPPPPPQPPSFVSSDPLLHFHLSNAAVTSPLSPRALCLRGSIFEHSVTVLIYSSSSHNILQPRVAAFLNLPISPVNPFQVFVGNRASLTCSGYCTSVSLVLQSYKSPIPFYIFPIHRADVVLGAHWLSSLGPFLSDFSVPSMQFYHQNTLITLTDSSSCTPQFAAFSQIQRYLTTDAIHSFFALSVHSPSPPPH
ncbi:UNVERIFIED_CONTAM: hypothetical protein Sradi_6826900 [Sesamum radiatum]|uniref:Retrotransposon gag domain-containing protein n=1 Tax=Sesamum radiatum TaxID=300843 RepID=A0AAW2JUE9_SESRA